MESLKARIRSEGKNLGRGILKIDSVINHQVDATLMLEAGAEFAERFAATTPTRVLTAEVSGIIPAMATAYAMGLPLVYARKHKPVTMQEPVFVEFAPSHTKGGQVSLMVSPEFHLRRGSGADHRRFPGYRPDDCGDGADCGGGRSDVGGHRHAGRKIF